MSKLVDLFWKLEKPSTKWTGYFDVYERHVSKFIGKKPRVLEIGVLGGGSIDMWHEYFGKGTQTIGIDIDPRCLGYKYEHDAKIVLGDQGDPAFWDSFLAEHGNFDIIIDDGGHTMTQQIVTVQKTFPNLNPGGVLVVEDTHTSYWGQFNGGFAKADSFLNYSKRLTDVVNQQHFERELLPSGSAKTFKGLYSVSFYNSQVVFEKENLKEFKIVDNKVHSR